LSCVKDFPSCVKGGGDNGNRIDLSKYESQILEAIEKTLPPGPGQRHRKVFDLVRALKGLLPDVVTPSPLRPFVERWHSLALPNIDHKDFAVTWEDFRDGWKRVRSIPGEGLEWVRQGAIAPVPRISTKSGPFSPGEWLESLPGSARGY